MTATTEGYPKDCPKSGFEDDPYTIGMNLCDPDGVVRSGKFHTGTDYPCTGHAHFAGEHIECLSVGHIPVPWVRVEDDPRYEAGTVLGRDAGWY